MTSSLSKPASSRVTDQSVTRFWNKPAFRALATQITLVLCVICFLLFISDNAVRNMKARGIPTDFSFWNNPAGFDINQTLIHFASSTSTYGDAFFVGLINTLLVASIGIVLATALGFTIGVARLSSNYLASKLAEGYVEVVRNIPLLLQLLFWYNGVLKQLPAPRASVSVFHLIFLNNRGLVLPKPVLGAGSGWVWLALLAAIIAAQIIALISRRRREASGRGLPSGWLAFGLIIGAPGLTYVLAGRPISWEMPELHGFNYSGGLRILPEFVSLLLGLTLYTASFIAEVVRAGLASVAHGQIEAAKALGLSKAQTLRLVVTPQALRVILPPLTNQYLNLTKNSSLAVFIGYPDLLEIFAGTVLNQTGAAVQVISVTMAVYLVISLTIAGAVEVLNRRLALKER